MSRDRSNIRYGLAAVAFGLTLAIAMVETIPRLLPGLMPAKLRTVQRIYDARSSWQDMMRGDRELGFVLKPDLDLSFPSEGRSIAIRTVDLGVDGIGHRDVGTKAPYQAVALGDSFTFCDDTMAETCWVKLLSDRTGVSFANVGVNGYSTLAEARMLEKIGPKLSPRLVLVGFFPNDFKDNVHFYNWSQSGTDDYWTWMRRKRRSDVSDTLARHSILYRLVDAARRYGKRTTYAHHEDGLDFVFRADEWWSGVVARAGVTPTYALTEQAFDELATTADRLGTALVVLLFPFKEQVYWDIARQYHPDGATLDEAAIDGPLDRVASYLDEIGVGYCDLTADLRAGARRGEQLYLRAGAHWTDAGNELAARSIEDCLTEKGLLEALESSEGESFGVAGGLA